MVVVYNFVVAVSFLLLTFDVSIDKKAFEWQIYLRTLTRCETLSTRTQGGLVGVQNTVSWVACEKVVGWVIG